jgi:hypothetical protein
MHSVFAFEPDLGSLDSRCVLRAFNEIQDGICNTMAAGWSSNAFKCAAPASELQCLSP